jgi:hypothetical protein
VSRPHLRDPKLEQFWRTTLAKWIKSQLTIRDFCRRHRLGESAFYFWRREIATRDGTSVATPTLRVKSSAAVRRRSVPSRPSRPAPPRRSPKPIPRPSFVALRVVADTPLELVLRTGHVLRVPPGYDANHLRAIAAALETQPC